MDSQRFKQAMTRLEILDERLAHKVRPGRGRPLTRPTADRLEIQVRDLAEYTLELKEVLAELFAAIAGKPDAGSGPEAG